MNYRHAYHAGNFADVVKHAILAMTIEHLKRKEKAFRVIDTHAGVGLYDLSSEEAQKTGEWRGGIGRVLDASFTERAAALLAPYLDIVRGLNAGGDLRYYPGSPTIARRLLRGRDRLSLVERHPADAFELKTRFTGDYQTRVIELDGWLALGAHVPPKEHRGMVLVDPPFEEAGEFERLHDGLAAAHRRWPGGSYVLWYPVKDRGAVGRFRERMGASGIPKIVDIELTIRGPSREPRLDGCGVTVVNPPWTLTDDLSVLLPQLEPLLADGPGGGWTIRELTSERGMP